MSGGRSPRTSALEPVGGAGNELVMVGASAAQTSHIVHQDEDWRFSIKCLALLESCNGHGSESSKQVRPDQMHPPVGIPKHGLRNE